VEGVKLARGGVYLARLDPAKGAEVGKLRPVVVLTDETLLQIEPAHIFICPLSRRSEPAYAALHCAVPARGDLRVDSYALVEHCRAISVRRLLERRLARLDTEEVNEIARRLQRMIGL